MNHIEEGTIHAWLDGALDATQAREVEAHVAACETCAAAVADARGLIAGASRILVALDDVPAGVIPKRAPVVPGRLAPPRQWRAARWVTGIAAALMLAVGVTTWNRDAVREEMAPKPMTVRAVDMAPTAGAALGPSAPSAQASSAPSAQPRDQQARTIASAIAAQAEHEQKTTAANAVTAATAADAAAKLRESKTQDLAVASGQVPPSQPGVVGAVAGGIAGAAASPRAAAEPVPAAPAAVRRDRAEEPVVAGALAGCYRTDTPAGAALQRADASTEAAAAAGAGAGERSAATRKAAASARTENRAPAAAARGYTLAQAPSVVRLDTVRSGTGAYVVRDASGDAAVGSWLPMGADSVRVDLQGAGVFIFARAARAVCP